MRPRRLLRIIEFAPLFAAALVAVVWFSTPGPLRGQMLSMASSGVSAEYLSTTFALDRKTVASNWLLADAKDKASKGWADVSFKEAAAQTSLRSSGTFDQAVRAGAARPFMLARDSRELEPLREFVADFPGVQVDAYLVEQPALPPVVGEGGVPLGVLPASPFAAAWVADRGIEVNKAFDPSVWTGYSANATSMATEISNVDGANAVYSYSWANDEGLVYRAYAYAPPTELLGRRVPATINRAAHHPSLKNLHSSLKSRLKPKLPYEEAGVEDDVSQRWCVVCHFQDDPESWGSLDEGSGTGLRPTAAYVGGPVEITPKTQFTTRPSEVSAQMGRLLAARSLAAPIAAGYFPTPSSVTSYTSDRFASVVWVVPDLPDGGGQTMLFVVTYPSDPHAAFDKWRESTLGRATLSARTWLAVQLPWLLAVTCTLLGVSLVAAPIAVGVVRRVERRELAAIEIARVQRDAHDRVYNRLGALSKRVDTAALGADDEVAEDLTRVAGDIRTTLADLQAILGGEADREGELDGDALLSQLRATTAAQAALHGITVDLDAPGIPPGLPARLGWDLQCVLDEAITNAARHGEACHLEVRLAFRTDALSLVISDDGTCSRGVISTSDTSTGIAGMRQRLGLWGGTVDLDVGPSGSTLSATVPMPPTSSPVGSG